MVAKKRKNKKKTFKSFAFYIFFAAALLGVVGLLAYTNFKIYQRRTGLKSQVAELEKRLDSLKNKNENLKESINYIESEDYLEETAREKLDLKKPGEEVVVIQREEEKGEGEKRDKNWWEKFKSIFIK